MEPPSLPPGGDSVDARPAPTGSASTRSPAPRPRVLARDLGDLLLQFSIALHRFGIYPRDHPALAPLTASILQRFRALFLERERLTLGVAQSQLVIDGVATDRRNPVLLELARRLHGHQIGAITFGREVDDASLQWLFEALAVHPERSGEPEGLRPASERRPLSGITLHPLGYDLLSLQGGEPEGWRPEPARATSLWLGLAQAAMATSRDASAAVESPRPPGDAPVAGSDPVAGRDPPAGTAPVPRPSPPASRPAGGAEVARSLATRRRESAYEQVIVGYLLQIAEELRHGTGAEVESVRRRMVEMVRALDEDTLERILRMGGDTTRVRNFVLDSSEALNLDAVLKLLRAAASSTERDLSSPMTRVLTKLALHAEEGDEEVRDQAAGAFRETVEAMILDWDAEVDGPGDADGDATEALAAGTPPSPSAAGVSAISADYGLLLDTMARASPLFPAMSGDAAEGAGREGPDGTLRLVQTALEADGDGPMVRRAVAALTAKGRVLEILRLTDAWPPSGPGVEGCLAHRLREELATPEELARLLAAGAGELDAKAPDAKDLAEMIERVGEAALDPLLHALEDSESRTVRRRAFDALAGLGPTLVQGLAPRIHERAGDPRWYVRRNLLSLLRSAGAVPEGFSPLPLLRDPDPRVRRSALLLAVGLPGSPGEGESEAATRTGGETPARAGTSLRTEALLAALADPDPGVVRSALLELQAGLPDPVVPRLVHGLLEAPGADPERTAELRPLVLRALRGCPARPALDAALRVLDGGRTLLGRRRLPPASAELREALGVSLSPPWRGHPDTAWIGPALQLAAARDPEFAAWARELEPVDGGPP
jgi:hypothetical protein